MSALVIPAGLAAMEEAIESNRLNRVGIGGVCTPTTSLAATPGGPPDSYDPDCNGPERPGCIRPGRTCDVQRIARGKVVAGGTAFDITLAPENSTYFQPKAVRATVTDLQNSDLAHRVMFTGVAINTTTQEAIYNPTPTLPTAAGDTIDGWMSDDWEDPDGYAVPVGWGWISNAANPMQLKIYGAAVGLPSTTLVLVHITVYGNASMTLPSGMNLKQACQPRIPCAA